MQSPTRVRRLLSASDPLVALWSLAAALVYLLHGFDGELTRDVALYAYGGQRVSEGALPYVEVFNRAGPLAQLVPGLGVATGRVVGLDDVLAARMLYLLITAASIGATYVLGREVHRSRLAGSAAAAAMLGFEGLIEFATYGPREKTVMMFLLLVAMVAVARRRWLAAGVLVGLATLTWQPVLFAAVPGVVAAVALGAASGGRLRALVRFAVGGSVPAALAVAAYAAAGALRALLECFVLVNAAYTRQSPFFSDPQGRWRTLQNGFGPTLWVAIAGLLALMVLAVATLAGREERNDPRNAALVGSAVAATGGLLWTVRAYDNWPDVLVLLPSAALGVGGLVGLLARRLAPRVAVPVTALLVAASVVLAATHAVSTRDDTLDGQRASVRAVLDVLPDARLLSVEAPQPLVLARRRNPSRFQLFGNGAVDYVDDVWPGGIEGYARWIDDQAPTLLSVGRRPPSWLVPTLERSYRRVGEAPGWVWWARRDLGRPVLQELREALRAPSTGVEG